MEVLKRLKGRAPLMHLKNLRRGPEIPRFDAMAIPPGEHKEVGSGSIDFVAVLHQEPVDSPEKAARAAILAERVEQGQSPLYSFQVGKCCDVVR